MSTILQFLFNATLFIAFFWVTDAGHTMWVPACFIVCHAKASFSPVLLEEQFFWQVDVLHLHVISSRRLTGAGAFVIGSGTRSPCPLSIHAPSVIQDPA